MSFSRTVDLSCPSCHVKIGSLDTIVGGKNRPYPGDPALCAVCGVVTIYCTDMTLRIATQQDIELLHPVKRKAVEDVLKQFGNFKLGVASCRAH